MDVEISSFLRGRKHDLWVKFLAASELTADEGAEKTVLVWEGEELIATGSRQGNVLKCIAVSDDHQGEGLTATLLTALRQDALEAGCEHLFLYTKPKNEAMFASLFFYPVARTAEVLLMENHRDGIKAFIETLPIAEGETVGAAVMHCNPFTKGHRYLIETAAKQCDRVYVFVLSEEGGIFPAADRMELVKKGTADLKNVTVYPTGPYLISSATFPTYFLKDKSKLEAVQCKLDAEVFLKHFAPRFGITKRFLGTEPNCAVTARYNETLQEVLPPRGVEVVEIPRLEQGDIPVSAGAVRALLGKSEREALKTMVPSSTYEYLKTRDLI